MSISFPVWDKQDKIFQVNINKTARDKADIVIDNHTYHVTKLRKNKDGTTVRGKTKVPLIMKTVDVTLQIQCSTRISILNLSSVISDTYYFNILDCIKFVTWIKNDPMPIINH